MECVGKFHITYLDLWSATYISIRQLHLRSTGLIMKFEGAFTEQFTAPQCHTKKDIGVIGVNH